jgi:hypothetical protein
MRGNADPSRDKNRFILKCLDAGENWCCAPNDLVIAPRIMTDCCAVASLTFKAGEPVAYATARLAAVPRSSESALVTALGSVSSSPTEAGSDSAPTASASTAPSARSSSTSSSSTSSGLSTGAKIGVGVGVSLGFLLFLLIGVAVWWSRRKAAAREKERISGHVGNNDMHGAPGSQGQYGQHVAEIDGFTTQRIPKAPMEMPAGEPPGYSR